QLFNVFRPGMGKFKVADVWPLGNSLQPGSRFLRIQVEDALHFFRREDVLEDGAVVRPAGETLDGDMLGDKRLLDEIGDRHPTVRRRRLRLWSQGKLLPDYALRLFPGQSLRTNGGT